MIKGKIIKITEEIITIGMDNGTIKEVRRCDLDFTPKLEDLVDVFEDKDQIIVTRRKETSNAANGGININMTNSVHTGEYVATEGKKVVNKIAYCLFAFLLGSFGAQYFYSRKFGKAIACVLFFWTGIPCIIGVVVAILALIKPADPNGNILV